MIDKIIKDYENKINAVINTDYNIFYIQPYYLTNKFGVIFNGQQIALCDTLKDLEQVINAMLFLLNGGVKTEL